MPSQANELQEFSMKSKTTAKVAALMLHKSGRDPSTHSSHATEGDAFMPD